MSSFYRRLTETHNTLFKISLEQIDDSDCRKRCIKINFVFLLKKRSFVPKVTVNFKCTLGTNGKSLVNILNFFSIQSSNACFNPIRCLTILHPKDYLNSNGLNKKIDEDRQ